MSKKDVNKPLFKFGPYVPLLREGQRVIIEPNGVVDYYSEKNPLARKLLGEILPDDAIVDAPSMILPLLLKKKSIWPPKVEDDGSHTESDKTTETEAQESEILNDEEDDDIQVVKIIDRKKNRCTIETPRYSNVDDYIRTSVVRKLSANDQTTLAIPDYNNSKVNELLVCIGLSQVNEFLLEDKFRRLASKVKKGNLHLKSQVDETKTQLDEAKSYNRSYKTDRVIRCPRCPFRTESQSVLDKHLENPHRVGNSRSLTCNWCMFKTKDMNQLAFHTYMVHKKRCLVEKVRSLYCCRYCDFESSSKIKYKKHIMKCEEDFDEHKVQALDSNDYVAITPKFITQSDIQTYESALKDLRLAAYNPHQIEVMSHDNQNNVLILTKSIVNSLSQHPPLSVTQLSSPFTSNTAGLTAQSPSSNVPVPSALHRITQGLMATGGSSNNIPNNRSSLLLHPKPNSSSAFANGIFVVKNTENVVMAPSVSHINNYSRLHTRPSSRVNKSANFSSNNNGPIVIDLEDQIDDQECRRAATRGSGESYVICEICDAYIESFPMFKSHMLEVHHVKLQAKFSSTSRPPLNCQRCQWRFFTDQGLDRHLLGSHGLVTISMQDKADKQCDSGRCTICGRKFAQKLVAHTKDFHRVQLKPAQLSYKCKVCSATYGLYSHFEKHVYSLHSEL